MTIKIQTFLNMAMVLLSWLTIPLLGSKHIKKFLPASLLIVLVEMLHARIGKKKKWWAFYHKPKSFLFGEFPFEIGPFLALSLWTLKWTYGNVKNFILLNGMMHVIFAYPLTYFAEKFRYYRLVRFNKNEFFLYFFFKAFILYGFQTLFEKYHQKIKEKIQSLT